jgi:hypothetical protein
VINAMYFLPSMTFTTLVGIFIGSVIYNGDLRQIKKALVAIGCYVSLLTITTITRVMPAINTATAPYKALASIITIIIITIFYVFGIYLGVRITKKAHQSTKGY